MRVSSTVGGRLVTSCKYCQSFLNGKASFEVEIAPPSATGSTLPSGFLSGEWLLGILLCEAKPVGENAASIGQAKTAIRIIIKNLRTTLGKILLLFKSTRAFKGAKKSAP